MLQITNTKINDQQINAVSARDLHSGLELKTEFTNWTKQFLDDFIQDVDFIRNEGKLNPTNNVPLIDYLFSLDMAKQIAMLTRTAKGKEVRLYFIECEKKLQSTKLPQTFAQALQLAADQAKQLELQAPLVKFANTVQSSSTLIDMKDLAKLISDTTIKIGRNTLMKLLRDRGFLNKDNTPSQKAVDADLMKAVERPWTNSKTDEVELTVVAQCTGKGQIYFCNNVRKFLKVK